MKPRMITLLCVLLLAGCTTAPSDVLPSPSQVTVEATTPFKTSTSSPPSATPIAEPFRQVARINEILSGDLQHLYPAADGSLWLVSDEAVARWKGSSWSLYLESYAGQIVGIDDSDRVWMIREDTLMISAWDGNSWTDFGEQEGWTVFFQSIGHDSMGQVDRDGRLWITSARDVRMFDDERWTIFTPDDMGMTPPDIDNVASSFQIEFIASSEEVWVGRCDWAGPGPIGGGARWYDGQSWYGADSPVATGCVTSIEADSLGRVWVGVEDRLWHYEISTQEWTSFTPPEASPPELRYGYLTDLVVDPAGEVWGIYMLCGGASCYAKTVAFHTNGTDWISLIDSEGFGLQRFIVDTAGTVWLFWDDSIYWMEGGELSLMKETSADYVTVDRSGRVWFITGEEGEPTLWVVETEVKSSLPSELEEDQPSGTVTPPPKEGGVATCPSPSDEEVSISALDPGTTVIEGFEPQFMDYLNGRGSAEGLDEILSAIKLDDGTTIWDSKSQVMTVDLTGDQVPEVLIALTFFVEGQYADGAIFVYRCLDGGYVGGAVAAIGGQVFTAADPDPGIRAVEDMNGDGVSEIIFSYIEIIGTHANFSRVFKVISWTGVDFQSLVQSDAYDPSVIYVNNGDGRIQDTNGDGLFELVLAHGAGRGPDADPLQRARSEIWAWDGNALTLSCPKAEGEPRFRFQAFQDGDDATQCGDYVAALALYQQAVFDEDLIGWSEGRYADDSFYAQTPTPDPNERSRIIAYGRYRILLLHVAQGNLAEAEIVYDTLIDKFPRGTPGIQYAELATVFWNAYRESEDLSAACAQASDYAERFGQTILKPLGPDFYGFYGREYEPEDICPFE